MTRREIRDDRHGTTVSLPEAQDSSLVSQIGMLRESTRLRVKFILSGHYGSALEQLEAELRGIVERRVREERERRG